MRRGSNSDDAERSSRRDSGQSHTSATRSTQSARSAERLRVATADGRNPNERELNGKLLQQPINENQPGWTQYKQIKEANDLAKNAERLELAKRHDAEKAELKAAQKVEREAALKAVPKGQGAALNEMRGLIADIQKPVTKEQDARHKAEREALQAKYKPMPVYKVWQEQPLIVSERVRPLIDQHITQDRQPRNVSQIIKQLTQRRDEHRHFTYSLDKKDVFRDEGKIIKILDLKSDAGIAAALATAQQKYGDVLTLTGSDAFKQNAVAVAVQYNLTCRYDDPALEKLRIECQAQKDAADRERAAAAELEKAKALTPVPVIPPIQPIREAVPPVLAPEAQQPIELDDEVQNTQHDDPGQKWHGDEHTTEHGEHAATEHTAEIDDRDDDPGQRDTGDDEVTHKTQKIDYLADIYKQLEIAKVAADPYSPLHNPAVLATDEDHSKHIDSQILASNDQFIAVIVGKQVQILKLEILNQNVEYEGHAEGVNRYAVGNEVSIAPQRDGSIKTTISEEREDMQTEARRERERDNGHGL